MRMSVLILFSAEQEVTEGEAKASADDRAAACFPGNFAVESGEIFAVTCWDSG